MPFDFDTARATARRQSREMAEALTHLPYDEARERAESKARRIGSCAAREAYTPGSKYDSGHPEGHKISAIRDVARAEAMRHLQAATQPGVEGAEIRERDLTWSPLFSDRAPSPEAIRKVFFLDTWTRTADTYQHFNPSYECQPAIKYFASDDPYEIGVMRRTTSGTGFSALVRKRMTREEVEAYIQSDGEDRFTPSYALREGWRRLMRENS